MKFSISLLFIVLTTFSSFAQKDSLLYNIFPLKGGKVTYEKVISVAGMSKEELYNRVKIWASSLLNTQNDSLQIDDAKAGMLAYKVFFSQPYNVNLIDTSQSSKWNYWETIRVMLKDGKAKIVINNISIKVKGYEPITLENFDNYFNNVYNSSLIKKYKVKAKRKSLQNFFLADATIKQTVLSFESYLTGKKLTDLNF